MKIISFIITFFTIIILGSFFWTSGCLGYETPVWFESFEDFPDNAINLKLYADYTDNPDDEFYFSGLETDWQSYIFNSTDGDFSVKVGVSEPPYPLDFIWVPGEYILQTEVETGGELFFDYYFSEDFSCSDVRFSFTYESGGTHLAYTDISIPHTYFNAGEWNSVELEWYWDFAEYGFDFFIYDFYLNGVGIGSIWDIASQGHVSGFLISPANSPITSGYALVDNFRMYTSINVVDPEEEPPEEYDFAIWTDYYNSISEKFATSTYLFNTIAETFSPIINKMGDFTLYVKEYFNIDEATDKGSQLGLAIPTARGYLIMIDDFIGLPLTSFLLFYFLTTAVVISYKVILAIIKLLKP